MRKTTDPREYVRASVAIDPETGCWNWMKAILTTGYGLCSRRDCRGLAHRFSYTHFVGVIHDGLTLDHLCRNRACVNPDHLEPVTSRENTRRALAARGPTFTVYRETLTGRWTAAHSDSRGAKRKRTVFRSHDREEVVRRMNDFLSTK